MVRLEKGRFVVEIPTSEDPTEDWLDTMSELIDLLGDHERQATETFRTCQLLKQMLPDWEQAKKMVE